jgi:O-antigen ligase
MSDFTKAPGMQPIAREGFFWDAKSVTRLFLWKVLPPIAACLILSVPVGLLISSLSGAQVSPLKSLVIAFFWLVSFSPIFHFRSLEGAFFSTLLLNSGIQLYQVALYPDLSWYPLMIGPELVSATSLLIVSLLHGRSSTSFLTWVWVLANFPSLVGAMNHELTPFSHSLFLFIVNTLIPGSIAYSAGVLLARDKSSGMVLSLAGGAALVTGLVQLLMFPLEYNYRGDASLLSLQFSRTYSVLGLLFLLWPAWAYLTVMLPWYFRGVTFLGVGSLFVVSFSRGAGLLFVLLASLSMTVRRGGRRIVGPVVASALVLGGILISLGFATQFDELLWSWLLRLNVASNSSSYLSFELETLLLTDRLQVWELAFEWFWANPLFGYGLGSVVELFQLATLGEMGFGGAHNLFLTIALERGVFGLVAVLFLVSRIGFLLVSRVRRGPKHISHLLAGFVAFLVLANSTGIELYILSERLFNVDITTYLLLFGASLEVESQ